MDITLDSIRDIRLYQPRDGYRFSVDSLLLYDFIHLRKALNIADLGAGCGIIGILLAGKYPGATVHLFEIQDKLALLAARNVAVNNLADRVQVVKSDIRDLERRKDGALLYDLVVSNPPFRRLNSGRLNSEDEKAIARHEITLQLRDCIGAASKMLKIGGRFCIIYHPCRLAELLSIMKDRGIEAKRMRFVHSTRRSEAKMILVEAVRGGRAGVKVEDPLYIYREDGGYTQEMEKVYSA